VKSPGPIWVDERNPIYRRGLITCLEDDGYVVAGESAALRPPPDLTTGSVLIFDLDAAGPGGARTLAPRCGLTIGLVREMSAHQVRELLESELSAALPLRTLTPARLLACLGALVGERDEALGTTALVANRGTPGVGAGGPDLTRRELDVLSLLADGDSTREIAYRLSYSERTVKNIVHDVRAKLEARTRAHVVALAARRGII
jgi:DNA-binding CsgD family transcriptional regulator